MGDAVGLDVEGLKVGDTVGSDDVGDAVGADEVGLKEGEVVG